ncbi:MAG: hypothetical protein AB7R89_27210 [Dehalococcoidia bacterium]
MMTPERRAEILAHDTGFITASIRKAVRGAIEEHYRAGNSITISENGRTIVVPPEDIPALLAEAYGDDEDYTPPVAEPSGDSPISTPNR